MRHHKVRRTALLALAILFLAVSSIWDGLGAIGAALARRVPWDKFKSAFGRIIDRLPAPFALLVFLVPFLIVEPLLVAATVAIAMGYVLAGCVAWIILKFMAIAVIPAIFDLTKHKLMTMPWFVLAYEKVMAFHQYAHRLVAPYAGAAKALLRRSRMRIAAAAGRVPGVAQIAARFAARRRSAQTRAALRSNG